MRRLIFFSLLLIALALHGCATTPPSNRQVAENVEWPTGPGTIPPSWYDYNPAYLHWYSPWFNNPEIPK
jgi:hypothetical protein